MAAVHNLVANIIKSVREKSEGIHVQTARDKIIDYDRHADYVPTTGIESNIETMGPDNSVPSIYL